MISKWQLRRLFEERKPRGFVHTIYNLLGLADANGKRHRDAYGRPICKDAQIRPEEIATNALAEAIMGEGIQQFADPDCLTRFNRFSTLMEGQGVPLLEADGVDVSSFLHINTYNATVGGLIDFQVLEGWNMPGYVISEKLFPSKPTRMNGQRMGRIGSIGDRAKRRYPGEPTERVGLTEEWIDTPETEEYALSIEINQEAPFFDLTGDILNKANTIGEALRYRKELRCIDVFAGITNPYSYMSTARNTYLETDPYTTGLWLNSVVNALTDEDSVNTALQLFAMATDPASGKRVIIQPKVLVTVPSLELRAGQILNASTVQQRTQISSSAATEVREGPNPYRGRFELVTSPLLHQRLTDTDGSALSEANSKRWFLVDPTAFGYMENWPLKTGQANPGTQEMLDRGILAFHKAWERGVPVVFEPRKVVRNKVA